MQLKALLLCFGLKASEEDKVPGSSRPEPEYASPASIRARECPAAGTGAYVVKEPPDLKKLDDLPLESHIGSRPQADQSFAEGGFAVGSPSNLSTHGALALGNNELAYRRDAMICARMPASVTVFTSSGHVVHQNSASVFYLGDRVSNPSPSIDVLSFIFQFEPEKLERMLRDIGRKDAGRWRGIVRVPASLATASGFPGCLTSNGAVPVHSPTAPAPSPAVTPPKPTAPPPDTAQTAVVDTTTDVSVVKAAQFRPATADEGAQPSGRAADAPSGRWQPKPDVAWPASAGVQGRGRAPSTSSSGPAVVTTAGAVPSPLQSTDNLVTPALSRAEASMTAPSAPHGGDCGGGGGGWSAGPGVRERAPVLQGTAGKGLRASRSQEQLSQFVHPHELPDARPLIATAAAFSRGGGQNLPNNQATMLCFSGKSHLTAALNHQQQQHQQQPHHYQQHLLGSSAAAIASPAGATTSALTVSSANTSHYTDLTVTATRDRASRSEFSGAMAALIRQPSELPLQLRSPCPAALQLNEMPDVTPGMTPTTMTAIAEAPSTTVAASLVWDAGADPLATSTFGLALGRSVEPPAVAETAAATAPVCIPSGAGGTGAPAVSSTVGCVLTTLTGMGISGTAADDDDSDGSRPCTSQSVRIVDMGTGTRHRSLSQRNMSIGQPAIRTSSLVSPRPAQATAAASGGGYCHGGGAGSAASYVFASRPPSSVGSLPGSPHSRALVFASSLRNAPSVTQILAEGTRRGSLQIPRPQSRVWTSAEVQAAAGVRGSTTSAAIASPLLHSLAVNGAGGAGALRRRPESSRHRSALQAAARDLVHARRSVDLPHPASPVVRNNRTTASGASGFGKLVRSQTDTVDVAAATIAPVFGSPQPGVRVVRGRLVTQPRLSSSTSATAATVAFSSTATASSSAATGAATAAFLSAPAASDNGVFVAGGGDLQFGASRPRGRPSLSRSFRNHSRGRVSMPVPVEVDGEAGVDTDSAGGSADQGGGTTAAAAATASVSAAAAAAQSASDLPSAGSLVVEMLARRFRDLQRAQGQWHGQSGGLQQLEAGASSQDPQAPTPLRSFCATDTSGAGSAGGGGGGGGDGRSGGAHHSWGHAILSSLGSLPRVGSARRLGGRELTGSGTEPISTGELHGLSTSSHAVGLSASQHPPLPLLPPQDAYQRQLQGAGDTLCPASPPHKRQSPPEEEQEQQQGEQQQGEELQAATEGECWHEVWATAAVDPLTGQDVIVLSQHDVSAKVVAERHLALVMEAEHRLLEQLFPKHILTHVTEEWIAETERAAAAGAAPAGHGGGGGAGRQAAAAAAAPAQGGTGTGGSSSEWRPVVRDCNALATWHPEVTLLFADIKGFTPMCKQVMPREVMTMLNDLFSRFDAMLDKFGVFKVETIGDCYFVAGGLIQEDEDGVAAVRDGDSRGDPLHAQKVFMFAKAMLAASRQVRMPSSGEPVQIRIGISSGPVVSGVVGTRMPRFCLFGDTVNTTSRMESTGHPGAIHASESAYQLLKSEEWEPTGGIEVKGKGLMQTYMWRPVMEARGTTARQIPASSAAAAAAAAAALRLKAESGAGGASSTTADGVLYSGGGSAADGTPATAAAAAAAAAGTASQGVAVRGTVSGGFFRTIGTTSAKPTEVSNLGSNADDDDSDPLVSMLLNHAD